MHNDPNPYLARRLSTMCIVGVAVFLVTLSLQPSRSANADETGKPILPEQIVTVSKLQSLGYQIVSRVSLRNNREIVQYCHSYYDKQNDAQIDDYVLFLKDGSNLIKIAPQKPDPMDNSDEVGVSYESLHASPDEHWLYAQQRIAHEDTAGYLYTFTNGKFAPYIVLGTSINDAAQAWWNFHTASKRHKMRECDVITFRAWKGSRLYFTAVGRTARGAIVSWQGCFNTATQSFGIG